MKAPDRIVAKLTLAAIENGAAYGTWLDAIWTVCAYDSNDGAKSETLPHAICLAIIEANGGMGDE